MTTRIVITPVGKPRMTQRDRWKERQAVMKYRAFADELRLKYRTPLPGIVRLAFEIPMPPSWSKKKKDMMRGQPHCQVPDVDNLGKATLDALCKNDAHVWNLHATKVWADEGAITITT